MNERPNVGDLECTLIEPGLYVRNAFFPRSEALRDEYDKAILGQNGEHNGMTALAYAYYENAYQFLTAGAERCLSEPILTGLVDSLQQWGKNVLGTSHVSTPQFRVYVRGCSRRLLRDNVTAPWHFMLSLTSGHDKSCRIKILREGIPGKAKLNIGRTITAVPVFNQLLVHGTREPYSVEARQSSMNPLRGMVLLDGYMW